jgi:hypothetical protein
MKIKLTILAVLLLALVLPGGTALAGAVGDWGRPLDRIITGDDYVLRSGTLERGAIVVLAGAVTIEQEAVLDGDLTAVAGNVDVSGRINGNLVVLGGNVTINDSAVIEGDCALLGGQVRIDESAQIEGEVVTGPEGRWQPFGDLQRWDFEPGFVIPDGPQTPEAPSVPGVPTVPRVVYHRASFAERVGQAFLTAVGIGVAALLIALFWPRHSDRIRSTIVREPVTSGLVGFVTWLAAALVTPVLLVLSTVLILVFCIGFLGWTVIGVAWLLLLVASLFGWAAIGSIAGRWIAARLSLQGITPAMEAGLGAFSVALALGVVRAVWLVGLAAWLAFVLISSVALGAVVLTRFGRRDYQKGQPVMPVRGQPFAGASDSQVRGAEGLSPGGQPIELEEDVAEEETGNQSRFAAPPLESEGPFPEE